MRAVPRDVGRHRERGHVRTRRRADGNIVQGAKVEGDIVPGDARKLLDFYKTYG